MRSTQPPPSAKLEPRTAKTSRVRRPLRRVPLVRPAPPAPLPEEDATAGAPLRAWLQSLPAGHDDCGVRLSRLGGGFGLSGVAQRRVRSGDVLVRIPRAAMLTAADGRRNPALLPAAAALDTDWRVMLLTLLHERALGGASAWGPYLATLPPLPGQPGYDCWAHPLTWPEGAVEELLQGSLLQPRALRNRAAVRGDARALRAAVRGSGVLPRPPLPGFPLGGPSDEEVSWAASILSGRAFCLDGLDGGEEWDWAEAAGGEVATAPIALVPWADALNHSCEAGPRSWLTFDARTNTAQLFAHKDYSPGEQVFDSYGPGRSPGDLLLEHGFAPPLCDQASVPNWRADLPATLLGPIEPANARLLAFGGLPPSTAIASVGLQGPDQGVLGWIRASCASASELEIAGWGEEVSASFPAEGLAEGAEPPAAAMAAMSHFLRPGMARTEAELSSRLERALSTLLNEHRAGEVDELGAAEEKGWVPGKEGAKLFALRALVAERYALEGALAALDNARGGGGNSGRRDFLGGAAAAAAAAVALFLPQPVRAEETAPQLETATFGGGETIFLEAIYDNLRYAGVKEVLPGTADGICAVSVTFDPKRITFQRLLKEYWKSTRPTQAGGQFNKTGAAFRPAVWAHSPAQLAEAQLQSGLLEKSGVFGGGSVQTELIDGAPAVFVEAPESERGFGRRDPKKLEELRKKTGRAAYLDAIWGLTTFCAGNVCGYVRFAKSCEAECLDVYSEYRNQEGTFAS